MAGAQNGPRPCAAAVAILRGRRGAEERGLKVRVVRLRPESVIASFRAKTEALD